MKLPRISDLSSEEQDWLEAYLNGTIEADAFECFQDRIIEKPELRVVIRRYLAMDHALQARSDQVEFTSESATAPWLDLENDSKSETDSSKKIIRLFPNLLPIAAAALVAFLLGSALMHWRSGSGLDSGDPSDQANLDGPSARGFAVIEQLFDASWVSLDESHREGDMLGAEVFRLASGIAKMQFFSGATMIVEGPAEISLKSAWEAVCVEGTVRMQVPPAARGFKLQAPGREIIDLGTEFGLVVRDGKGHLEVLDGEVAVRRRGAERLLQKRDALDFGSDEDATKSVGGQVAFPDLSQFDSRATREQLSSFQRWESHRDALARDKRLIAYYAFDQKDQPGTISNLTIPRNPDLDGSIILAEPVAGRWSGLKAALEFRRPGTRVRVNIPGEFSAFTFACWTRIDSLDRQYNALFMGDGYETGEPHWQIREDGKMMLSVMVDDSRPHPKWPRNRFHHVYFSPPMWDLSMSGQWLHLASVFDPGNRSVSHYVNGKRISRERIEEVFLIEKLRIGNGEIGNWGQPFREDPTFAIRNLNGRMDEMAIFKAALSDREVVDLFEKSRFQRN